jgi:rhamnosyltransferase
VAGVTMIVRVRDERDALAAALASLRRQTAPVEIVVVDSGSVDGSLELARAEADTLLEIPPASFTFGGALNAGAEVASGELVGALSAHCFLPRQDWLERAAAHLQDPRVAAVNGTLDAPSGTGRLRAPELQGAAGPADRPNRGYSHHAALWRAAAWRAHRFDERLPTAEDKEWSARVRAAGWLIAFDPELVVEMSHRRRHGTLALARRAHREARVIAAGGFGGRVTLEDAARLAWTVPEDARLPPMLHRLNYRRLAEIGAWWTGGLAARARRRSL